jgi:prepilin peptidase dependent protein B
MFLNNGLSGRRMTARRLQRGMTLVELMVASAISVIVVSAMVILMGNTLGTGTQTIKMTRLSQEMRTAMQIMTRELRRANYHGSYAACFGNANCLSTLGISGVVKNITINGGSTGSCFYFWYDRPGDAYSVDQQSAAGFRRVTNASGVGSIEMWLPTTSTSTNENDTSTPNCTGGSDNWQSITDPTVYDITSFCVSNNGDTNCDGTVDDAELASFTQTVGGSGATLGVQRLDLRMTGKLKSDPALAAWLQGNTAPTQVVQDFVRVRNDIPSP